MFLQGDKDSDWQQAEHIPANGEIQSVLPCFCGKIEVDPVQHLGSHSTAVNSLEIWLNFKHLASGLVLSAYNYISDYIPGDVIQSKNIPFHVL